MTHTKNIKWYPTKTGITITTGGTLTIASGATLVATGYSADTGTVASLAVTGAATVGTTLGVTGNLTVGGGNVILYATGNIYTAGTATLKGIVCVGQTAATAGAILLDPNGSHAAAVGAGVVAIYFTAGGNLEAKKAGPLTSTLNGAWA
jgi:hypothetical protein